MSNATQSRRGRVQARLSSFHLDWLTAVLIGFLAIIQLGALITYTYLSGLAITLPSQSGSMEFSGGLLAVLVLESAGIVTIWRVYKRLSRLQQLAAKYTLILSVYLTGSYLYLQTNTTTSYLAVNLAAGGVYVGVKYLEASGLRWIVFNAVALALGIAVTTMTGILLAPRVIILLLVLAMVWDHYAVRLTSIMETLVDFSTQTGLTNYLIIPNQPRFHTQELKAYLGGQRDEKPSGLAAVIGLGDYILPGMLTISLYANNTPTLAATTLLGTTLGFVVLRDTLERDTDALPALLWVNTGAIAGLTIGILAYPRLLPLILGGLQ